MAPSYTPHVWQTGPEGGTLISAVKLNEMEQGIAGAYPSTTASDTLIQTLIDTLSSAARDAIFRAVTDNSAVTYSWSGTANASTSLRKLNGVLNRTNLSSDPRALTIGAASGKIGWIARWFGTAGAGTVTTVTATDGPLPALNNYQRKTWTTGGTAADTGFSLTTFTASATGSTAGFPVSAGDTFTHSVYLRPSAAGKLVWVRIRWRDAAGVYLSTADGTTVNLVAGQWARPTLTAVAPANAALMDINLEMGGTDWLVGDTLDGTGALSEKSPSLNPYFDGSTTQSVTDSLDTRYAPKAVSTARRWFSGAPTLVDGLTAVSMTTTSFTRGSDIDAVPAGSTGKIKVLTAGVYLVTVEASFTGGTSGQRNGQIRVNGVIVRDFGTTGTSVRIQHAATLVLAANDLVDLSVFVGGGGTTVLAGTAEKDIGLTVTRLGA